MRWRMEFHQEGSGVLETYSIEAPSPAAAVVLGRKALLEAHPSALGATRRSSLWDRAQRLSACDASGWVLYRIGKDDAPRPADAGPGLAT